MYSILFIRYINSLQSNFTTEESTWQLLQRQFNQITAKKPLESHFKVVMVLVTMMVLNMVMMMAITSKMMMVKGEGIE